MRDLRLLFIRHGETDWNMEGRLQGQHDIPLNRLGQEQAAAAGRRAAGLLAKRGLTPDKAVFVASPLGRTQDTMRRARIAMGLDAEGYGLDDRLKEFSFGEWEGLTWSEVKLRNPDLMRQRGRDKWGFVPPGGESYAMLADRIRPWLDTLQSGEVVVSHGGVARALMTMIGGQSTLAAPDIDILQGRVLKFEQNGFSWV